MRDFQRYTKEPRAARRTWWAWSLAVVFAVFVAGGAVLAYETGGRESPGAEQVETSPTGWFERVFGVESVVSDEPLNVLVLGVDTRPDNGEEGIGSRTDTIMLVRVVPESGDVKLLSVPRDFLVEVEPGVEDRINAAYNFGGIDQTIGAMENYSGIAIDHYAVVDFEGFKDVINAMGGVEIDVEDEIPPKHDIEDGVQTLNGRQALFYARYRGTSGGDLDRIKHQQQLVAALRSKAFDWNTVTQVPEIIKVANRNVVTDLGLKQAIVLGRVLVKRGPHSQMTSVQLKGNPETRDNGDQVLVPDDEANEAILDQFRY